MSAAKRGVVLYLHVHQPWRVREYTVFDTAENHNYFSGARDARHDNREIFTKVADKSYRPMNALLKRLLEQHEDFKLSLSITGTFIEQAEAWAPDVLDGFRDLVKTGRVEILAETYYHSLAFFYNKDEFARQVRRHTDKITELFGVTPTAFRGTELAYDNSVAKWAERAGYETILAEGWDTVLGWRSPNYVYRPIGTKGIKLLMKNYRLSDDIAFRFGNKGWSHYPLQASTYSEWSADSLGDDGEIVNLFMDYETFGEHQWSDTGIFDFFGDFVDRWLKNHNHTFYTISGASKAFEAVDAIDCPTTTTWADAERDLSAWLGNSMQHEAMRCLYDLAPDIIRSGDQSLIADWSRLTSSDHAYYMSTKYFSDGDVHAYFNPYDSPYDAFLYFMNALRDVRYRLYDHNTLEQR